MDKTESYIEKYKQLFKKHNTEFIAKLALTAGKKALENGETITIANPEHIEYFALKDAWVAFKKCLDGPLINKSKYKSGNRIKGIYKKWEPKGTDIHMLESVTKEQVIEATILSVEVSVNGNGKLYYKLKDMIPDCWECNPSIDEEYIQELLFESPVINSQKNI